MKGYITITAEPVEGQEDVGEHSLTREVHMHQVTSMEKVILFHQLFDAFEIDKESGMLKDMIVMGIRENVWPDSPHEVLDAACEKAVNALVERVLGRATDDHEMADIIGSISKSMEEVLS